MSPGYSLTVSPGSKEINQYMKSIIVILLGLLVPGLYLFSEAQDAEMYKVAGFATVNGNTIGGAGGDTVWVNTGNELQDAINDKGTSPRVIMVNGIIDLGNSEGLSKIDVKDVDDLTIRGAGEGAEFNGIGLKVRRASNIIIRNLKIHHVLSGEKDCIGIEGPADHIWIDHCELYNEFDGVEKDYYDGLLDAKADCEYLTYSWNHLHDSWKTALAGSSEGDSYDRKLTMHHNYFSNCNSRIPLFRGGTGHFFNNYYVDIASTAINSRINACVRIENNYFKNTNNPWVSAYSDILGGGEVSGNILDNSPFIYSDDTHELPVCVADIPYEYASFLHEASLIPDLVMQYAGTGMLDFSTGLEGNPSGLADELQLRITPNPIRQAGILSFTLPRDSHLEISLINMTGSRSLMHEGFASAGSPEELSIDMGKYPPGIYLLELRTRDVRALTRLVICR